LWWAVDFHGAFVAVCSYRKTRFMIWIPVNSTRGREQ
jgi:hypothetical protein